MDERWEIANIVGALAVYVDAREWEALTALFASNVYVDYTSLFGGSPSTLPREELIGRWRDFLPGFTRTTHVIGTPRITLDGATARAEANVVALHFLKDELLAGNDCWVAGGTYEMTFEKEEDRWSIASLTLARAWTEGNRDLPRIVGERLL
jgi:hypothetical protein